MTQTPILPAGPSVSIDELFTLARSLPLDEAVLKIREKSHSGDTDTVPSRILMLNDCCLVSLVDFKADKTFCEKALIRNKIGFRINLKGGNLRMLNGVVQRPFQGTTFSVGVYPGPVQQARWFIENEEYQYVALLLSPADLMKKFGLDADLAQSGIKPFLQTLSGQVTVLNHPLPVTLARVARDIFAASFAGDLQKNFLLAKALELMCLVIDLLQSPRESDVSSLRETDLRIVHNARDIINREFVNPPLLAELARMVGTNRSKLAQSFKEAFGQGIFEYSQQLRLEKARELLQTGNYTIQQVADAVGYQSQCSFTRAYKKMFSHTPKVDKR